MVEENFAKEVAQFGAAVKKLREYRGLTQEDILERTGIARSTLVEIENGRQFPRGLNILRLCVAFKISPKQLTDLAFKKWKHPVSPLVMGGAKRPKRIRSTRMRVDRGGQRV